jgi:hypothetical protein
MTMSSKKPTVAMAAGVAAALAAVILMWCANVDSAKAKSQIFGFTSQPTTTQAGGHPDIITTFELGSRLTQETVPCYCNDPKELTLHSPAGVIANPHVVSVCPVAQLALFECPADSQAGVVPLRLFGFGVFPLYRTVPQKGQAGLFAFTLPFGLAIPQYIAFTARTGGDYGLDVKTVGISHILPLLYYAPIFWGVPGEHFNDFMRFNPGEKEIYCETNPIPAMAEKNEAGIKKACTGNTDKSHPSSLPIAPLTQNPTTCVGPLTASIDDFSYDLEADHAEGPWPATTGCDALSFDPSLAANPTTTETDTASGLEVTLRVPQFQDPNTPSPSELKANTVTLPEGFSINPNAADGKTSCSDAESAVGTEREAECPETSKVGTVSIDSSALPAPIDGFIYLGEPKPGEPYRLVLTANGFGTAVKLLGTIHADPQTGQLVTTFENLPETPFQEFVLHFFGSERGILATPTQCGTYPVKSTFTPWDGAISAQNQTQFFVLDHGPGGGPCPGPTRPFAPGFTAGSRDNTAGVHAPFGLKLTREDGNQNLSGVTVTTPPGFLASLRGIPYCPQTAIDLLAGSSHTGRAELAAPACPAASRIGTADTGAGAGTHPLYTPGSVYLAGPYKGAPVSLLVVVPAVSGPYDFGNVAVRVAVNVDPATAALTAVSDPLPRIIAGVPLRLRSVQVELDRKGFALNPTNCDPFSVTATLTGDQGAASSFAAPFQVANCTDLGYAPKLSLNLSGGVRRRGHPAITAVFKAAAGEANTGRVSVALPPGELLDNSHIGTVCTRPAFATHSCPASSSIGTAEATTPLLDRPLKGNVYLRSNPSGSLPDMVLDLEGQIDIELAARISASKKGALRTTFQTVPDAPVSSVVLRLQGGSKGLLQNSESLCGASKKASVKMTGQNGRTDERQVPLRASCGAKHGGRPR